MTTMPQLKTVRQPVLPRSVPGMETYDLLRQEMARTGLPSPDRVGPGDLRLLRNFCMIEPVERFCWAVRPHQSNLIAPRERYATDAEWMAYGSGKVLEMILRHEPEAVFYQWRRGFGLECLGPARTGEERRNIIKLFGYPPPPPFAAGTRVRLSTDGDSHLSWSRGNLAVVVGMNGPFVAVDVEGRGIRRVLPEFIAPLVTEEALAARLAS